MPLIVFKSVFNIVFKMLNGGKLVAVMAVALFLVSWVNVSQADQRQKILDFHAECLENHGVEEDALIEALEGDVRDDNEFYLHLFCASKKAKFMSEDGTVDTSHFEIDMKDIIEPQHMELVASLIRKCVIQREDIMTTIREAIHCFVKEDHPL